MAETSGASMKNTETRKQDHRNPSHVEQINKCYQDVVTMKKRENPDISTDSLSSFMEKYYPKDGSKILPPPKLQRSFIGPTT